MSRSGTCAVLIILLGPTVAMAGEWSGNVTAEYQYFSQDALSPDQHTAYYGLAAEPEYHQQWDDGKRIFTFAAFARYDSQDNQRTHNDIRDLSLILAGEQHEWRIGIREVFWGVAESWHLVNIINQTDLVEDLYEEEKLGQPMINLALIYDWGTVDFFVLPYFRERTFPGKEGRLRTEPYIDTSQVRYQSDRKEKHSDGAVRWSYSPGDWDIGLAYFTGTSREPEFIPGLNSSGAPVLIPVYKLIDQLSLDVQATKGNWLWKLETLRRSNETSTFEAAVGGLEYTFYGLSGSAVDLGIVAEYLYDNRETGLAFFQDDIMLGFRFAFNDTQSTDALVGIIKDRDDNSRIFTIEASRRIGERWKMELEAIIISSDSIADPIYTFRQDDYLRLNLGYYF